MATYTQRNETPMPNTRCVIGEILNIGPGRGTPHLLVVTENRSHQDRRKAR